LAIATVFVAGCSRQDFSVEVEDARGIDKNSPVRHFDENKNVGRVSNVEKTGKGYRLDVVLDRSYRKTFHEGLSACPFNMEKNTEQPTLVLFGGYDTSKRLLTPNSHVPEMKKQGIVPYQIWRFLTIYGTVCVVGLTLLFLIKRALGVFFKFVFTLAVIGVVAYGVYCYRNGMSIQSALKEAGEKTNNVWEQNKDNILGTIQTINIINSIGDIPGN